MTSAPRGRVGRPSVATERRAQLVSAFIELIGRKSLDEVTLDDVATAAGVSRSALNHFIGTREELIVATVEELAARYISTIYELAGTEPGIGQFIDLMFGADWIWGFTAEDIAFDALLGEAIHKPHTRAIVKAGYEAFIDEVNAALRRSYPDAPAVAVREIGYAIACLSEHNIALQQLGFPRNRVRGVKRAALMLAASLGVPESR